VVTYKLLAERHVREEKASKVVAKNRLEAIPSDEREAYDKRRADINTYSYSDEGVVG
jgi:hypothetical protein